MWSRESLKFRWKPFGLLVPLALVAGTLVVLLMIPGRRGGDGAPDRETLAAIQKGQEFLKMGKPRQALAAVSALGDDGPGAADVWMVRGLAMATLDQSEPSRRALERSLSIRPDQPLAAKVLAAIYFSRSEDVKGLQYLDMAAALNPEDFRPWYAIAEAFLRRGQAEEAATAFRKALERNPGHDESRIGLLKVTLDTRPPEESTSALNVLLKSRPDDAQIRLLAARHARILGQSDQALQEANRAIELDPDLVEALVLRAQLNHIAGKTGPALADVEHAIELEPNHLGGLNLLAQLQAAAGQGEQSRATFSRHRQAIERADQMRKLTLDIEKNPNDPEPRWRLAQAATAGGLRMLAIQSYRAALSVDPQCGPAIEGLRSLDPNSLKALNPP